MDSRKAIFLHPPHVGRHFICAEGEYTFCRFLDSIPIIGLQSLNQFVKFMCRMEKCVEKLLNVLTCSYKRTKMYSNHRAIGGDNINQGLIRTESRYYGFPPEATCAAPASSDTACSAPHRCLVNELIEIHDAPSGITI